MIEISCRVQKALKKLKNTSCYPAVLCGLVIVATQVLPAQTGGPQKTPKIFVTHHSTTIKGQRINYTATAGETILTDTDGSPIASFFSFAYAKEGVDNKARPVTFVFNGGPGSSSVWLHMGVMGPRRVVLSADINPRPVPPFGLEDNPYCPLDVTDLVFIDPVGTGFSIPLGTKTQKDFSGLDQDAESVAQFIEQWLSNNDRWNSPKFVVGESYGSIRASILPRALMGGSSYMGVMRGITVDGIVLLGTALGAHDSQKHSLALNTALAFPSLADAAWYHSAIDRKGRTLLQFDEEVTRFATGDYLVALTKADSSLLSAEEMRAAAAKMSLFIGIPVDEIVKAKLRIPAKTFSRLLLQDKKLAIGMYDARYTLPASPTAEDVVADDPAMGLYVPGFIAAFHQLLSEDLRVEMPTRYRSISFAKTNFEWDYKRIGIDPEANYSQDLAIAMRRNPSLRLLVSAGYYDLVTPALTARHMLEEDGIPVDRMKWRVYESGHMLYLGGTAGAFADDVRALITGR